MGRYSVFVFCLCIFGAVSSAEDRNENVGVRDVLKIYSECWNSDGLKPCLKMKAVTLLDRVARMQKISLFEGVVFQNKEVPSAPLLTKEQLEETLPRALDAKDQTLTKMIFDKVIGIVGSGTVEISMPKMIEEARKHEDDKFDKLTELFGEDKKMKKKKDEKTLKDFLMDVMAHKIAMIPLLIAGLFVLALKALTYAKIAFLIAGIIWAKKLIASKNQGGGQVQHVHASAGWNGGAGGGWNGGGGGWDKRSLDDAQALAYKAYKQE
ncbi:uncharacterized protein LOC132703725 [Cylas formicarius]|uniref:uncharacterized protein LOC132703725 n=1 Tax=Cylas formicarius TaxID=197179 RepID=UPI002958DA49|nr:uncharacterized protein LOC132703725 [Cylas formicarius]